MSRFGQRSDGFALGDAGRRGCRAGRIEGSHAIRGTERGPRPAADHVWRHLLHGSAGMRHRSAADKRVFVNSSGKHLWRRMDDLGSVE